MRYEESRALIRQLVGISGGATEVDHVWLVDEHEPQMVLTPAPTVTVEANRIYYVDISAHGEHMLYVPASGAYSAPNAHRYLALDSNMFNGFDRYVVRTASVAPSTWLRMEQLIDYALADRLQHLAHTLPSRNHRRQGVRCG